VIGLFVLAAREGFAQDLLLPAGALIFVLLLIANSLLNKWGWTLW